MSVMATCKFNENPIKSEGVIIRTRGFAPDKVKYCVFQH